MLDDLITAAGPIRPPQDNIPRTKGQREKLLSAVEQYVQQQRPVPPLSINELQKHCDNVLHAANINPKYRDYTAVLMNNEAWRETVAAIPYNKRLLLLPKCLRHRQCRAEIDDFGLVCARCGRCIINDFQTQAEQLGYAVLVAEGSPVVMSLIETGKIEAVIGVSCLSVLEQVFPYMEAGAVPGIAIPLLQDGCENTTVDSDWVWDAIYENSDSHTGRLNLEQLRAKVQSWFTKESLQLILGGEGKDTEKLALDWLAKAGKRWRPFLAVSTYQALNPDQTILPESLTELAVAVECFHKASLIHDDIEDNDLVRYGQKTLHAEFGVPIAINVGDYLLGEGYRLLAGLNMPDSRKIKILKVAAKAHRDMCLGQGNELSWMRSPGPLTTAEVIDIFRMKTSPAFAVALKLGALFAGADDGLTNVLKQYSDALGIAYQIRDDINDFNSAVENSDLAAARPSLLAAMAYERASATDRQFLESVWKGSMKPQKAAKRIKVIFADLGIEKLAFDLKESYKSQAINSLTTLENPNLKGLLLRVVGKIFYDSEIMRCCNDFKAGYARRSGEGEKSA